MIKYNEKLIKDYVLGNDIEDYDIEDLENDFEFMYSVLKYTMDTEMFNFCSDELKNNVRFIREVVELFDGNKNFILSITNNYLKNNNYISEDDKIFRNELLIITSKYFNFDEVEDTFDIKFELGLVYKNDMKNIKEINKNPSKYGLEEDIGLGFVYIVAKYNNSAIINKYYAEKMIENLFYNDKKYNFEELMHLSASNKEIMNESVVNSFILNLILIRDECLHNYIASNINLLSKVRKSVKVVYDNWEHYMDFLNSRRAVIISEELDDFVIENKIKTTYSLYDMIDEIMFELGYSENRAQDIDTIQSILHKKSGIISFTDSKLINFITSLVKKIYSQDVINESVDYEKIKKDSTSGKILVLNNYKK